MKKFTSLESWKQAHLLVMDVHACARRMPRRDRERIGADLCGSSIGIGAKIAAGNALMEADAVRDSLETAVMSAREVEVELMLARDLGCLAAPAVERLLKRTEEVRTLIRRKISRLRV